MAVVIQLAGEQVRRERVGAPAMADRLKVFTLNRKDCQLQVAWAGVKGLICTVGIY
jgi:hypothetical protein